jgi:molecular chaperone HscA
MSVVGQRVSDKKGTTMDKYKAAILLDNLIARIAHDPATNQHTLPGVLSRNEVAALHAALAALGEPVSHAQPSSTPPTSLKPADVAPIAPIAAPVVPEVPPVPKDIAPGPTIAAATSLSLDSSATGPVPTEVEPAKPASEVASTPVPRDPARDVREFAAARRAATPDPDIILCLDFGTARSKAFAAGPSTNGTGGYIDLGLGKLAGEPNAVYAVSSSLWIEDDGLVFVGPTAVRRSQRPGAEQQKRFDSLKQELSQGDLSHPPDRYYVPADMNPSNVLLTHGHLLTLYLAYLTDLAETALLQKSEQFTRHVARRFALPSWEEARLKWVEELLRRYLARAQIVGDVFRGRWTDGLPAAEVKAVVDATASLTDGELPLHLIPEDAGVLEPVAAGASRLRADGQRGLVMVIDVGAGTTDFALFVTVENERTDGVRAFQIQNGVRNLRQAGDTVDTLLRQMMLQRMSVRPEDPEFKRVNAERLRTIREDKETLFKLGQVRFNDGTSTITLSEFVQSDGAQRFAASLKNAFDETLKAIDPSFVRELAESGLKVVLTGGGATLPMVEELARGATHVRGQAIVRSQAPLVPEAFQGSAFAAEYPELAVAIGGASDDMPALRKPLKEWMGMRTSTVVAKNLPISGAQ